MRLPLLLASSLLAFLPAFAHPGWGIVVDREGSVYYTDLSQVWKTLEYSDTGGSVRVRRIGSDRSVTLVR